MKKRESSKLGTALLPYSPQEGALENRACRGVCTRKSLMSKRANDRDLVLPEQMSEQTVLTHVRLLSM